MWKGVFQRATMAIVLIGALLAPLGTCLPLTHKAAHSCCSRASEPSKSVKNNCCTASAPLPAIVIARNLSGSIAATPAREFVSSDELASTNELPKLLLILPHSPPAGAFILRI